MIDLELVFRFLKGHGNQFCWLYSHSHIECVCGRRQLVAQPGGLTLVYGYLLLCFRIYVPSVLWRCWLGGRKGIWPVKKLECWGVGMVICLERGADLHVPSWCHCHSLSLASVKSRLVLPFWYRLTRVVLEKGPLNGCVCVCVCVCVRRAL